MSDTQKDTGKKYFLVMESKGFWLWKKKYAIYRSYSYMVGDQQVEGKGLIGRYKRLVDAINSFKSFGKGNNLNILGVEV